MSPAIEPATPRPGPDDLALALSGGGARAAYQVGVLRALARRRPELAVPVLTGVSAGAINAIQLANHRGTFAQAIEELRDLWLSIRTSTVYRTDLAGLAANALRWGAGIVLGNRRLLPRPGGLVDTAPLRRFLQEALRTPDGRLDHVARNIAEGRLRAVGVTTTHYGSGRSVTWVQGHPAEMWRRTRRESVSTRLDLDHVLASTAIPIVFPAIRLADSWHGDGSIGQLAPLSPALHLGASRIITVTTRALPPGYEAPPAAEDGYPGPGQIFSVLLNATFMDALDPDVLNLNRISALVKSLPADADHGLRSARALVLRPSRDLGALAGEHQWRLPHALRFLLRRLGDSEGRSMDLLSMILFEPSFIRTLLDLGEADGEANAGRLEAFVPEQAVPAEIPAWSGGPR